MPDVTDVYPYHDCMPGVSPYRLNYLFEAADTYANTVCWQITVPGCDAEEACCEIMRANLYSLLLEIGGRPLLLGGPAGRPAGCGTKAGPSCATDGCIGALEPGRAGGGAQRRLPRLAAHALPTPAPRRCPPLTPGSRPRSPAPPQTRSASARSRRRM
jgi:hypothetical protein